MSKTDLYPPNPDMSSTYVDHGRRAAGIPQGYTDGTHMNVPGGAAMADNMGQFVHHFGALSLPGAATFIQPPTSVGGSDGSMVFTNSYSQVHPYAHMTAAYGGENIAMQYTAAPQYAMGGHHAMLQPYTPGRGGVAAQVPRELPTLENRRGSYSTSATESAPHTPFFGTAGDRGHVTRVASAERSSYTTPSPQQPFSGTPIPQTAVKATAANDPEIDRILTDPPAIPRAVPAVFTDHVKTLEQCLDNRIPGNKNVYIRGLHPTTDDELLQKYAERFGEVDQSKAIIDTSTGACKGFGFAKFKNVRDSERCIRGFYRLGYEVGFARESFNARLKAEGDDLSTNLYISNLPKDITEPMLIQIFSPYQIASSKILRDSNGNSRGVGFARFESREICERIIKDYNGMKLGGDVHVQEMQVRYADTPAQKELKRVTAERRQYRTNEYNIGAYGTHAIGMNPTMYQQGRHIFDMRRSGSAGGSYTPSFRSGNGHGSFSGGHGSQGMGRGVHQYDSIPEEDPEDDDSWSSSD
ncbi:sporulation-specific protein 5 [Magnaporthiopsis poae ATCC 64411]|uniref:Sporulation-specific protein 5 n=1 Tax=Magnaporthiopsis poae (strain ATCC 64411 / 73-15) TaxID=644358 RepID=A0A0C4DMH5_MAGP6|nr:sporulation-specific protein 5 [Magnaporthiopsis poae ATCC 64411]